MNIITSAGLSMAVPCFSYRATAFNVVGPNEDLLLVGGLHPEVGHGVVEQEGQGWLQR